MRVIAGEAKGQYLKTPKGLTTRPTTGLVREAVFSMLETLVDKWSLLLDLYAGSGALGIEALSRNKEVLVDFVEQNPRCCAIITDNLASMSFSDRARVYCCSTNQSMSRLDREYDVVVLDPPYADRSLPEVVSSLVCSKLVGTESTIVVQHSKSIQLADTVSSFYRIKNRRYGETNLSIYQKGEAN